MYQVSLDELNTEHVIARSIFRPNGEMLLAKGYRITEQVLRKLPEIGQSIFWVMDEELQEEMNFEELVSEQIMNMASNDLFANSQKVRKELKTNEMTLDEIKGSMQDTKKFKDLIAVGSVQNSAINMIHEIMDSNAVLINISSIRSRSHYVYQNAVDASIVALMIGRRFGFKPHELEELAMGCLLMDTGYLVMPEELVNRAGRVTFQEYQLLKEHPEFGFKILKENQKLPLISSHIAYQHHECQDGTGYPRGLIGSHAAPINSQKYDKNHIHRHAEIASVAEVYTRLSNPKPGMRAPSPQEVVRIMVKASKSRLNRSVVDKLIGMIPIFPVGSRVIVTKNNLGRYVGYTGVVTDSNPNSPNKPIIHLMFDQEKNKISPPIKVALSENPDLELKHKRLL